MTISLAGPVDPVLTYLQDARYMIQMPEDIVRT